MTREDEIIKRLKKIAKDVEELKNKEDAPSLPVPVPYPVPYPAPYPWYPVPYFPRPYYPWGTYITCGDDTTSGSTWRGNTTTVGDVSQTTWTLQS